MTAVRLFWTILAVMLVITNIIMLIVVDANTVTNGQNIHLIFTVLGNPPYTP